MTTFSLAGTIKQLEKAAADADIGKLCKLAERLRPLLDAVSQVVANARSAWPFSAKQEEVYLRESNAD